jgi:hypothetical protein
VNPSLLGLFDTLPLFVLNSRGDRCLFSCFEFRASCAGFCHLLLWTILDVGDSTLIFVESLLLGALVLLLVARCALSGCRAMLALRG